VIDPLKIADEIDLGGVMYDPAYAPAIISPAACRLLAAALRGMEARVSLSAHRDREPVLSLALRVGEYTAWVEDETVLALRAQDAEAAYVAAREGS